MSMENWQELFAHPSLVLRERPAPEPLKPYQKVDRALQAKAQRRWLPTVRSLPEEAKVHGTEMLLLNQGTGHPPATYLRRRLTLPEIAKGRRATLPWRRMFYDAPMA